MTDTPAPGQWPTTPRPGHWPAPVAGSPGAPPASAGWTPPPPGAAPGQAWPGPPPPGGPPVAGAPPGPPGEPVVGHDLAPPAPRRGVGVLAAVLIALSATLAIPASVTVWAQRTATDQGTWSRVGDPLHTDPGVTRPLAERIAAAPEDLSEDETERLTEAVRDLVEDPDFASEWRQAIRSLNRDVQRVADGDQRRASIDVTPWIEELQEDPDLADIDGLARLERLEIVVLDPGDADRTESAVRLTRQTGALLAAAALGLGALAVTVSRRRWRAGAVLGGAWVISQLLTVALVVAARGPVATSFTDAQGDAVAERVAAGVTSSLVTQSVALGVVAGLLAIACAATARVRRPRAAAPGA